MKKKDKNSPEDKKNEPQKPATKEYERWKDEDKNRMGNDVASEIKIANAGGQLEGGDNKQWHMDQGNFDEQEKKDFENCDDPKIQQNKLE
jgi:hypothetical protein